MRDVFRAKVVAHEDRMFSIAAVRSISEGIRGSEGLLSLQKSMACGIQEINRKSFNLEYRELDLAIIVRILSKDARRNAEGSFEHIQQRINK